MNARLLLCLTLVLSACHAEINYPQAPKGGEQAVSNLLESNWLKPFTHLLPAKQLTIAQPFRVYGYDKNYTNLFSGRLLSEMKSGGWCFLLTDGTNSAELFLGYDEKDRKWPEFGCTCFPACPNSSNSVLMTLQAAEKLPEAKKEDFELRFMCFFDLPFYAVWLHGKSNDMIIPVPVYGKWQDYQPYSEGETTKLLKHEVESKKSDVLVSKGFEAGHGDVGQFIIQTAVRFGKKPPIAKDWPLLTDQWRYETFLGGPEIHIRLSPQKYADVKSFMDEFFGRPHSGHEGGPDGKDSFYWYWFDEPAFTGGIRIRVESVDGQDFTDVYIQPG